MKTEEPKNLLARYFAGDELGKTQRHVLMAALGESEALADEAADHLVMSRLLKYRHVSTAADDFSAEVLARLGMDADPKSNDVQDDVVIPMQFSRRRWIATGAAAALAMGGGFWWARQAKGAKSIAWIRGVASANWSGGNFMKVGDGVAAGGRIKLISGFVAIGFEKGVEVVLEGTGDLEILAHNHAVIHQGSVAVYVPPDAQGFTLDGPGGSVKDRGASFGVSARGNEMDVHALKGKVDAMPAGRDAVTIPAKTALRMHDGIADLILARPQDFLTTLPPENSGASFSYLHWSFDEMEGETVYGKGRGFDSADATGHFDSGPGNNSVLPRWDKGISGSAIHFHGKGDHIRTNFAGLGGAEPRTVCCWVKVPQDLMDGEGYALIGWGAHLSPGDTWQMSINPSAGEGPLGRLRMGTNRGQVIGTTDLRDDTWHHVAAVLFEGRPANVATHVLLYVDGKLESTATKSVMSINTDIQTPSAHPVIFGVDTGSLNDSRPSFRGALDEPAIYAGALSQAQIIAIMEEKTRGAI